MRKVCIFVDGENLRHSIVDLFMGEFDRNHYLPKKANWDGFFDWLVDETPWDDCERVRTYWYVVDKVDFAPWGLNQSMERNKELAIIRRNKQLQKALSEFEGDDEIRRFLDEEISILIERRRAFERRFNGWQDVQDGISRSCLSVEFRRAGSIRYSLFDKQLGEEKAVDVALAVDMFRLRNNYDVAVLVSGDQDYVPAVHGVKDAGKHVTHVSFQTRNNKLLPGGARRLDNVTDYHMRVPYRRAKEFLFPDDESETRSPQPAERPARVT